MYRLLRDHRFSLLVVGHALNGIGSWAALIAIWGYAAYHFHLGPVHLGLLVLAWGLPPVLLAPVAGVVIDRVGPRKVAVVADLCNAAVALTMIMAGDVTTLLSLTVLHGIGKAFAAPAYSALPARAVGPERLFEANALFTAAADLALVLGPVVAAGVIAAAGPGAAFAVDALTYVVGAVATLPLRLRPILAEQDRSAPRAETGLRDGLRVIRSAPGVGALFVLGFGLWLSFGTFLVLEPVFVRDVLGQPVTTFALLQTAFGIGLVGTGVFLSRFRSRLASVTSMSSVIFAAGLAATAYAATSVIAVAFIASLAWGGAVALFSAPSRTLLLRQTPDRAHGRVLGAWQAANSLGQLLPALAVPALIAIGTQATLVGCGILLAATGAAIRTAWVMRRANFRSTGAVTAAPRPRQELAICGGRSAD
ncbi:MAG TPA: MFS transporter [Pilimelia sp.]|nr:MFS transporter [Pilimelia sp.]